MVLWALTQKWICSISGFFSQECNSMLFLQIIGTPRTEFTSWLSQSKWTVTCEPAETICAHASTYTGITCTFILICGVTTHRNAMKELSSVRLTGFRYYNNFTFVFFLSSNSILLADFIPVWQTAPLKPSKHKHTYPLTPSTQDPLLWHGPLSHSLMSEKRRKYNNHNSILCVCVCVCVWEAVWFWIFFPTDQTFLSAGSIRSTKRRKDRTSAYQSGSDHPQNPPDSCMCNCPHHQCTRQCYRGCPENSHQCLQHKDNACSNGQRQRHHIQEKGWSIDAMRNAQCCSALKLSSHAQGWTSDFSVSLVTKIETWTNAGNVKFNKGIFS